MTLALALPAAADSPLARLDARWKLASLGVAAFAVTALQTPSAAGIALAISATLVAFARLPRHWLLRRLRELAVAVGPLVILLPLFQGLDGVRPGLLLAAKALAIAGLTAVVLGTTPLPTTLHAAHSLRVPGAIIQIAMLSYRAATLLGDEFDRLRRAVWLRGFRARASRHSYRTVGNVIGTLIVRSGRRAEGVALAMRCRGFDGRFRSVCEFHTRPTDVAFAAAAILTTVAIVAWDLS
ncbi:MAG: energy-coupling factor transporter transmembrane component T [Gemmataceae bacterium]